MRHSMVGLLLLINTWSLAHAITSVSGSCPNKFIGTLIRVSKSQSPFNPLAKINVTLKVEKVIKGSVDAQTVNLDVLKHGPVKFVDGKKYEVSYRLLKWPCSITST
ncbi:MAG: hypothetical protein ISR65_14065 [Bacteriovoracaceae bacterium]|nr:hypothetical protein [Bacteriovoracaceae bacterium]